MDILTLVNNGMQNPFFDTIVPIIYELTDEYKLPIYLIILLIIAWVLKKGKVKNIIILCFFALFFAYLIVFLLKHFYISPRPYTVLSNIRLVGTNNTINSFPSGHIAISMTVISVILMKVKEYKKILIVLSVIYMVVLSFTLLYAGVHYPTDLIAGGIVGIISAAIATFLFDKYLNKNLLKWKNKIIKN